MDQLYSPLEDPNQLRLWLNVQLHQRRRHCKFYKQNEMHDSLRRRL